MTNIASKCRSANIVRDHATILPDDATPKPDGIFGKGHVASSGQSLSCPENRQHVHSLCIVSYHFLTPIDEHATRYHWLQHRNTDANDEEITARITDGARVAFEEDRRVLEAVHRGMANKSTPNINLALDAGSLRFRRELTALIDREQGLAVAR
jgi:Vanillate O-demethylase oxygenase C-terminal domain